MFEKLFSIESKPGAFFRRIDWTAFWSATLIAFLVYFFTLGPSVGLEDSGELATAADHLGVPHPPGYPFWSLCSWVFCRLFAWVTYQGQPTPAWAVSLFSAVAGAFAAGCTAMLICRSGSDMLDSMKPDSGDGCASPDARRRSNAVMALAGGLGGSLVFAFSPVEWSQSTIVEIYSLNALFLMAVFLLSYRWMRRPSDRILWLTAFVFGLGLTNYQVLLLAAVPLAIIVALRNVRLFRDFALILIPVGLTANVLKIGAMMRAGRGMSADVINKHAPLVDQALSCPCEALVALGCVLLVAAPLVGFFMSRRRHPHARRAAVGTGLAGAGLVLLATTVFAGTAKWLSSSPHEAAVAPLVSPTTYAWIGAFLAAACACALGAAFAPEEAKQKDAAVWKWYAAAAACGFVAILVAGGIRAAGADGYMGVPFSFAKSHLMLLAGVVALFGFSCTTPRGLAFAIPVAAVQVVAHVLLVKGAMNGLTNPHSWWFIWPVVWNFAMLGLAFVALPSGRSIAPAMFFAELGVSFYAYMPIVSDLRNPPMNWGYPRTWEGFKHAIMRGQYEAIKMPDFFSAEGFDLFMKQLGFYFQDLRMQFTLVAAALALLPFTIWKMAVRTAKGTFTVSAVKIAAVLYVAVAGLVALFSEIFGDGEVPLRLDKALLVLLALLVVVGLGAIAVQQSIVVYRMVMHRDVDAPTEFGRNSPVTVRFGADNVSQQWLIASGVCFALMSLFLVALANVKGDIQDGFIQKVKFISSHGMFSLWIGYGLLVGLLVARRVVNRVFRDNESARRASFAALCIAAACVALIPVYENYTNKRLVFAMGSAEQNGHTFGWQFGNYQLRGANAIREELSADEEPLPNPMWPEEMEPHSIFFGGTDPGRFVPTYMIYSANVRPDVYLITQNALADDTYMSVERDLYGDEIWIPSKEDSAESFNIYVNEVQTGKRPANGDLRIENGRVQVTGALGVMEINGILTKMMFDHERLRHAFYVEESYQIQWMYPYLSPHGLIMKINPEKNPLNASIIRNDMEFWDWYQRRLLRDPAFRRDFPAQKSFSKLRAAIAGLYARTGRFAQADQAYREAVMLYPASPEATFRYAQEVLMPTRRWAVVEDILAYTDRVDPNNSRTESLRQYVKKLRSTTETISSLTKLASQRPLNAAEQIALSQSQLSLGQAAAAADAARAAIALPAGDSFDVLFEASQLLSACGQRGDAANAAKRALGKLPPDADRNRRLALATMLADGGLLQEADACVNDCLRVDPQNVDAWLHQAIIKDALGQTRAAQQSIIQAYKIDQNAAMRRLQSDENLQRIAAPLFRQR